MRPGAEASAEPGLRASWLRVPRPSLSRSSASSQSSIGTRPLGECASMRTQPRSPKREDRCCGNPASVAEKLTARPCSAARASDGSALARSPALACAPTITSIAHPTSSIAAASLAAFLALLPAAPVAGPLAAPCTASIVALAVARSGGPPREHPHHVSSAHPSTPAPSAMTPLAPGAVIDQAVTAQHGSAAASSRHWPGGDLASCRGSGSAACAVPAFIRSPARATARTSSARCPRRRAAAPRSRNGR